MGLSSRMGHAVGEYGYGYGFQNLDPCHTRTRMVGMAGMAGRSRGFQHGWRSCKTTVKKKNNLELSKITYDAVKMNTPSVQNDNLGARKWKAPAADPLNSEIERLAAAAAWKKACNAAASSALGLALKTKVMPKNIQNNIATSTSGPTTTNTESESSTKTVPPTTAKPLANQSRSCQASVEVDDDNDDNDDSLASYCYAPKKLNRIIEFEDGLEDDSVDEVEPRLIKTKKNGTSVKQQKATGKREKDVLEILTDSEAAEPEEESAEEELGEIFESVPGDL